MEKDTKEIPIDDSRLPPRAADQPDLVEAAFTFKFPSPGDPDGKGAERLAEILSAFPPADRPFLAAIAAMTYEEYKALVAEQEAGRTGR